MAIFKKIWGRRDAPTVEPEETRSGLANPAQWLVDVFTGGATSAGVSVNSSNGMQLTTVFACVSLLAETVAQLPLTVFRKVDEGKQVASNHRLTPLLTLEPNPNMTSFVWRELQQSHVASWGNGYAHIERNRSGEVLALRPLRPDWTRVERVDGELVYYTRVTEAGQEIPVPAADVLHIPALGFDGICGWSPIAVHRETLGLAKAAQTFGSEFFGRGASLQGVLEAPGRLSPEAQANLRKNWNDTYGGLGNNKTAVLVEGLKYTRIGVPPEDAQFLDTRKFQRSEIAALYKIPPHMIGDLEKATFSNITEQSIQFLRFTMTPWLIRWEQELNRKLLTAAERRAGLFIKFNANALLRGTPKDRYDSYASAINTGWMNRNEARELEDLNRVDGLDGFLVPLNMDGGHQPDADPEPSEPDPLDNVRAIFGPLVDNFAEQLVAMDTKALLRLAKNPETFRGAALEFLNGDQVAAFCERRLLPVFESMAAAGALGDRGAADLVGSFATWYRRARKHECDCDAHSVPLLLRESVVENIETILRGD